MPSLLATILRSQIKLLSPLIGSASLEQVRKAQDALSRLGERAVRGSVVFHNLPFPYFDASWAIPLQGRVRQAILYLHGGGYTAGTLPYAKVFGGLLAQMTGRAVLCVGYRLAPEDPYPAALQDALSAYQRMLTRYAPQDIALAGESAGGGLCFCLALKLKQLGLPQPERIVAISPWTDLTMSRDVGDQQKLDILLTRENLQISAGMYTAGSDPADPLISPLFGDLEGLPPSLIFVGGHEILLDDSVLLQERLVNQGCLSELHIAQGLWHVYPLYGVPEAREALRRTALYLTGGKRHG
ncbi:MAG: alpha/beta hydrolase [Christensenellales bacterium]